MGYLLGGLPLAIVAFVIAVAGFSAGVGTLVVWVGLPVLVLTLRAARGFAVVERRSTEWATGRPLPPHHYREPRGRGVGRWFNALAEPQSWRDLVHAVVGFPVRLVTFVLAVAWTVGGVGGLLYVTWQWALPENDEGGGLLWLLTGIGGRLGEIAVNTVLGAGVGGVAGVVSGHCSADPGRPWARACVGGGGGAVPGCSCRCGPTGGAGRILARGTVWRGWPI
ncbi:MAG TPA: sensor domain-containing protein, partial [Acidimicrobiia bacterium]